MGQLEAPRFVVLFYDIGNFIPCIIKPPGMRTVYIRNIAAGAGVRQDAQLFMMGNHNSLDGRHSWDSKRQIAAQAICAHHEVCNGLLFTAWRPLTVTVRGDI